MPGPTDPNRNFVHAGTSAGMVRNFNDTIVRKGLKLKTLYDQLNEVKKSFSIYYFDTAEPLYLKNMRKLKNLKRFKYYDSFLRDLKKGKLADYSFIEPRMAPNLYGPAND
jgi:hypothetical protein